jgi:polyisoprenoid-binding protein YceI
VNLDPAQMKIDFTLGDALHTVRGAYKLKRGQIRFDPITGKANGAVIVDATSGESGNKSRDKKMHKEDLES